MTQDVIRHPYKQAKSLADWLVSKLAPHCEKITIGGSIRRERQMVKDVELVLIAKTEKILVNPGITQLDMFSAPPQPEWHTLRSVGFINTIYEIATLVEGSAKEGRNLKMIKDGIPIDIFIIVNPLDFGRQVAIRTGSVYYTKDVIAQGWSRKGWCGTPEGLRRRKECTKTKSKTTGKRYGDWFLKEEYKNNPTPCPIFHTEESFFEFIGIKWKHPSLRK